MKNFLIISCLLALFGAQAMAQSESSSSLRVWMDDFAVTADGQTITYLHVYENDVVDYTAFNLNLNVPKGLTVAKVKVGRETRDAIELSERATSTHSISCGMVNDGEIIKVIATSSQNSVFYPDDENGEPLDEIFTIGLVADTEMVNGIYTITMDQIKFTLPNGYAYYPEDGVSCQMTLYGGKEPTGIEQAEEDGSPVYYDLAGRKLNAPKKGVIIQNNKKVLVK